MTRKNSKPKSISSASYTDSRDSLDRDSSSSKMYKISVTDRMHKLTQKVNQLQSQNQELWNQSHSRNHNRSQNTSSSSSSSRIDQDRIRELEDDLDAKQQEYNDIFAKLRSKKCAYNTIFKEKTEARESMIKFREKNEILRDDIVQVESALVKSKRNNSQLGRQLDQEFHLNTCLNRSLMNSFHTID